MTAHLSPHDARVIVRPLEAESVRASGIVIPETGKVKPTRGEVLAVGPGSWAFSESAGKPVRIPLDAIVGDVVIFDKFSGVEYTTPEGEKVVILRAHEVLAFERDAANVAPVAVAGTGRPS